MRGLLRKQPHLLPPSPAAVLEPVSRPQATTDSSSQLAKAARVAFIRTWPVRLSLSLDSVDGQTVSTEPRLRANDALLPALARQRNQRGGRTHLFASCRLDVRVTREGPTSDPSFPGRAAFASSSSAEPNPGLTWASAAEALDVRVESPALHALSLLRTLAALTVGNCAGAGFPRSAHFAALYRCWDSDSSEAVHEFAAQCAIMRTHSLVPSALLESKVIARKLLALLADPTVVAARLLPSWCVFLAMHCSWMFPLATRTRLLQLTAFPPNRCLVNFAREMQRLPEAAASYGGGRENARVELPERAKRRRVQVTRRGLLRQARTLLQLHTARSEELRVEFEGEPGTGEGPNREFFTLVARELQARDVGLWLCTASRAEPEPEPSVPARALHKRPRSDGDADSTQASSASLSPRAEEGKDGDLAAAEAGPQRKKARRVDQALPESKPHAPWLQVVVALCRCVEWRACIRTRV